MSAFLVAEAIQTRLEADTGVGGLYETGGAFKPSGIYYARGTTGTLATPYLVITIPEAEQDNAMNSYDGDVAFVLTYYDLAKNGHSLCWPAFHRIVGDAILQNMVPTYGLDRHLLVLDTNSTKNPFGVSGTGINITGHSFGETEDTPERIALQVRGVTRYSKQGA